MTDQTDLQLLRAYAVDRSEAAFAELVCRHADFVYSAALRMVCDSHLAQDVSQNVFIALAKNAPRLTHRPVLAGWLHCTARNIAAQTVRTEVRRRNREQEVFTMNELLSAGPDVSWEQIAPHLDVALGELSQSDRDALLLRFFEKKSAREMAQTLGTSEEAAQKRANRAVERLREFLSKRAVTIGTGGLVVLISANAVQSAPVGFAATLASASTLAGSTVFTITKALAMTTLQKSLVTAALAVTIGASLYEAVNASTLHAQVRRLQLAQEPLQAQVRELQSELEEAANRRANPAGNAASTKDDSAELLKLRGEVTRLHGAASEMNDPFVRQALVWKAKETQLRKFFEAHPELRVPEMALLSDFQWLSIARNANLDSTEGIRKAQSQVRKQAENNFMPDLMGALKKFADGNDGLLPTDLNQLKPYFEKPVDDAMLQQYKLVQAGNYKDVPAGQWAVSQKSVIDPEYDTLWKVSPNGYGPSEPPADMGWMQELGPAVQAYQGANNGQMPEDISQLKPYLATPTQNEAFQKALKLGIQFGGQGMQPKP